MERTAAVDVGLGSDRHGLGVLDLDTCLARLAGQTVGRVAMLDEGNVVVFPVNHVVESRTGWSVLVQGTAEIPDQADADRLDAIAPPSWFAGARDWVVVRARTITGRALAPGQPRTEPAKQR